MNTVKYLARLGLAAAIGVTAASAALATPIELTATSGTGPSATILLPNVGGGGQVSYSKADFNDWDIQIALGISDSPLLATGALDLTTIANCLTSCNPLTIAVSDIGFMTPVGPNGLATGLSYTQLEDPATITQWAYMDTGNSYFGSTDPNATADFEGVYDSTGASLIGTASLNEPGAAVSAGGGSGATGPYYSLTLVDQFCSNPAGAGGTCTGGVSFSSDGAITASAPEPGTLALFGAGLLGLGLFAGRRRSPKALA
ncbi:MAG: PEP-CTERM sorting domain-containing protein [Steroidobacteraceae bacterium]